MILHCIQSLVILLIQLAIAIVFTATLPGINMAHVYSILDPHGMVGFVKVRICAICQREVDFLVIH